MPSVRLQTCPALVETVRALVPSSLAGDVCVVSTEPGGGGASGSAAVDLLPSSAVRSTCGDVQVAGCPRCVEAVVADAPVHLPAGDAVAVTPGWLARWSEAGHPPVQADRSVRRVVLLQTTSNSDAVAFERLASQTGWAPAVLAVGTAHLQLHVDLALTRWQLATATDAVRKARSAATANVMALEVFGQLAVLTDEAEVVRELSELFATLFAARVIHFVPAPPYSPLSFLTPAAARPEAMWQGRQPWQDMEGGFRLRIDHGDRLLGVFELSDFAVPEAMHDYINLSLSIARTAGMAIANARAMRGIIPICAYCKKIRDGQGEWWALETYLARHSDARFSHGLCPTCMRKQMEAEGLTPEGQ